MTCKVHDKDRHIRNKIAIWRPTAGLCGGAESWDVILIAIIVENTIDP